jgi:Tfp pilus assembly protein PilV
VRTALVLALSAVLLLTGLELTASAAPSAGTGANASTAAAARKPVFAIYYLWWSTNHWQQRLGANYPRTRTSAPPLPATLDSTGCGAHSTYKGNKLTDVPTAAGYNQDAATIERDVRLAASMGLKGFAVNWNGAGTSGQSVTSGSYNQRLQWVFDAVHKINAEGIPFRLILNYKASATKLSTATINGDLSYFTSRYGSDAALDHSYSSRPEMVWAGSWKYGTGQLAAVAKNMRSKMYLIGDEKPTTWNASRAAQLDGASYYWSSQDPWRNPGSFAQIKKLADAVHAGTNPDGRTKTWLAPFTPGYNAQLLYGTSTCVPRNDGKTMHELFRGNRASNPDGWTFISWNEISEGSYIVPLTRYGQKYTNELKTLIANNG